MKYEDFALKIEPLRDDEYPVIVLDSPAGQGRGSFKLPFRPEERGTLLTGLSRTVRGSRAAARPVAAAAVRTPPQQVGDQLFRALFSGPVRTLYDRSLGRIEGRRDRGLRIKLHLDPEHPDLAQLPSLPWEFLYQAETRDFLNLNRLTPIVRYLDVPRPTRPLPFRPPLRILVVISSPTGVEPLDLPRERQLIEAAWGQHESVAVVFLEEATTAALRRELLAETYHVLHYMGHGDFDQRTGRGGLLFEDRRGAPDPLTGQALATMLRGVSALRMVFLNACDTARATRVEGLDPFAGVATALVMGGLPAVVAMQFPISDEAAIAFSEVFYPRLAAGDPVDAAVAEGRLAIYLDDPESMEWGTPVLFMRTPDGALFDVSAPPPPIEQPTGAKPEVVAEAPPVAAPAEKPSALPIPKLSALPRPMIAGVSGVLVVILAVIVFRNWIFPPSPTATVTPQVSPAATTPVVAVATATSTSVPPTPATPPPEPPPITVRVIGGAEMVYVPEGPFEMGSKIGDSDERPVHTVALDAFWIDRYEVTNTQYVEFLNEVGGHLSQCEEKNCIKTEAEQEDSHILLESGQYLVEPGYEDHPVTWVTWYGAKAYCEWRGRNASEQVRLSTEAEWEKAARGTDGRIYPWGNSAPDGSRLNFCDVNCEFDWKDESVDGGYVRTAPVGNYEAGKSFYGVYDMAGNVWEWVADWYGGDYYSQSPSSNPQGPRSGSARVLRGGAWSALQNGVRAAFRGDFDPDGTSYFIGFRCATSPAVVTVVTATSTSVPPTATPKPTATPVPSTATPRPPTSTPPPTARPYPPPTTPTPELPAGTVRVIGGAEMVYVPAGPFEMGSESGAYDEKPVHTVTLDAFWIDRYEVTNGQYVEFLNEVGGHVDQCEEERCVETKAEEENSHILLESSQYLVEPGYEAHPVIAVRWYGAKAYCQWRGRNAPEQVRLPTEAQWEKAARGTDGRIYPWGNSDPDGSRLNFCDVNCEDARKDESVDDGYARTAPVGSYEAGKSFYGVYDMAGNVSEWVADWYEGDYYSQSPSTNPQGPEDGNLRVLRGGSLVGLQGDVRAAGRYASAPTDWNLDIGFRCAASPAVVVGEGGHITYQLYEGHVYRIEAREEATPEDVSLALDGLALGSEDAGLNISPDGAWLALDTDRFDPGCVGWPCLAIVKGDVSAGSGQALSAGEAIRANGKLVHPVGFSAVASGGNLIVYPAGDDPTELWAVTRSGDAWGTPLLLTGDSPYVWHEWPAISADGSKVVLDCGDSRYGGEGTAICEVDTDGTGFRVVLTPAQGPEGSSQNALHHPDYAPDGSIVFQADWDGEQIWRLPVGAREPVRVTAQFDNDGTPCVLPDGRIASLWLNRPGGPGFHEIKVMAPDGSSHIMVLTGVNVFAVGLGCGK